MPADVQIWKIIRKCAKRFCIPTSSYPLTGCSIQVKDPSQPNHPYVQGALGVTVVVVGNEHGDSSSNPE